MVRAERALGRAAEGRRLLAAALTVFSPACSAPVLFSDILTCRASQLSRSGSVACFGSISTTRFPHSCRSCTGSFETARLRFSKLVTFPM